MRNLQREVVDFQKFLEGSALPNFKEDSKDCYDFNHEVAFDSLTHCGQKMIEAVRSQDPELFDYAKDHYFKIFTYTNSQLAKQYYEDLLDHYLDEGLDNLDAQTAALEHTWNKDPRYQDWLPSYVVLSNGKQTVELVGNPRHASKERPYVSTKEVGYLKDHPEVDPWDYVRGRNEDSTGVVNNG
jgi:hypothetical protein